LRGGICEGGEGGGGATRAGRREVILHVDGASADSELWGWDGKRVVGGGWRNDDEEGEDVHVTNAYAEASLGESLVVPRGSSPDTSIVIPKTFKCIQNYSGLVNSYELLHFILLT